MSTNTKIGSQGQTAATDELSCALRSIAALDAQLMLLLGQVDLMSALGMEVRDRDVRPVLMRAILSLQALQEQVIAIALCARCDRRRGSAC
jgi:hypothetical protein